MSAGKILKSVPLRMHFKHSRAKVRVFEQNTDIIKFKLFHSGTAILMNHWLFQYDLSVLNHV